MTNKKTIKWFEYHIVFCSVWCIFRWIFLVVFVWLCSMILEYEYLWKGDLISIICYLNIVIIPKWTIICLMNRRAMLLASFCCSVFWENSIFSFTLVYSWEGKHIVNESLLVRVLQKWEVKVLLSTKCFIFCIVVAEFVEPL